MGRSTRGRPKAPKSDENKVDTNNGKPAKDSKRPRAEKDENASVGCKMPKRAAACSDFKERSTHLSEKSSLVETKKEVIVEDEPVALALTSGLDDSRPNRRLKDFTFHDVDGSPQPVEMLEFNDLYISGVIMPLDDSDQNVKEKAVRCDGFGRIESWDISGYEEGSPVIWVSTDSADYECMKPSSKYRKVYNFFFDKASVCVEVYKKLSRTHGGNPDLSLEELVAGVVRSMSGNRNFSRGADIKDFLISQADLIYNQLIGLDVTSKKNDQVFTDLPVLVALRDEKKQDGFMPLGAIASGRASNGSLKIGGDTAPLSTEAVEDEDMKLARLLQEEENWASFKQKDRRIPPPSSKVYIKINEDEIANDYPVPSFYKTCVEETDEFIIIEDDGRGELPQNVLHDWTLYNSDALLISLELLPMMPCADVDVTIFGSGAMSAISGFCMDVDSCLSSSGSQVESGLPIYLSAIKEWKIEFGGSLFYISIRTDVSWYRLGKPSKQYAPWYEPVLKTAKLGISIITLLTEQTLATFFCGSYQKSV